jgi:2-isopropylmalate synthase
MSDDKHVRIFDTTLRDGEQSAGAAMTAEQKLDIARALSRLGVDVIEAGFPASSPSDREVVARIAAEVGQRPEDGRPSDEPPTICGLARCERDDIDAAWGAVAGARRPRIHTFLATSDIHMRHKLRMSRPEVLARVAEMVAHASALCPDVEFSPEDAGRSEPAFLYQVLETAIRAGARTLNIPDTVGYRLPHEFGALIAGIRSSVAGIEQAIVSVHCHDDLGLATANTLAGIDAGARQAEVTVNGIGERAGNCALEEVVMALHTRRDVHGLVTGIDARQLVPVSRLVSACTGMVVQPNKAIVGANAFAHESGIHQDGMLKNEQTYEIMRPEAVGAGATRLVLGRQSGRHAFRVRMAELGFALDDDALARAFDEFKRVAAHKRQIDDGDLVALVAGERAAPAPVAGQGAP